MEEKRIVYLDVLKIMAIFMVIMIHIMTLRWINIEINTFEWGVYNLYHSLIKISVPLFVMASGVVFLDINKKISVKNIYFKYISKLLLILLIWSAIYAVFRSSVYGYKISLDYILFGTITGKVNYHFWFIYMLIGVYIFLPVMKLIVEYAKKKDSEYILIIWFIFSSIIPFLRNFGWYQSNILFFDFLMLAALGDYLGYFLLGYYLDKYEVGNKKLLYALGYFFLAVTFIGTALLSTVDGVKNEALYSYFAPNIVIMAAATFVAFKNIFKKFKINDSKKRIITILSQAVLGIFVVHDLFIILLIKSYIFTNFINPIFAVLLLSSVVYIVSLLLVLGLKKIPFINKII